MGNSAAKLLKKADFWAFLAKWLCFRNVMPPVVAYRIKGHRRQKFFLTHLQPARSPNTCYPSSQLESLAVTFVYLSLGLLGLFFGGDWLVRGASGLALALRVSPLVIGLTIVGFGTSTPELMVSLDAAMSGRPGIAIGNVVGSNTANILLILGLSGMIGALTATFSSLRRDLVWMAGSALALVLVFLDLEVSRVEGALMFAALVSYIYLSLKKQSPDLSSDSVLEDQVPAPVWKSLLIALAGLVAVLLGARFLVDSASEIARAYGISEAAIGLTIVAVGTSLPELATSMVAAFRGQREIALGNVIGSNIFNILAILGITAMIVPIPVESRFLSIDVPVMLAATFGFIAIIWAFHRIGRAAASLALVAYALYIAISGVV